MRYRTKLLIFLVALVLVSSGTLFGMLYWRTRSFILNELSSKVTSIAASTAKMLDGDALATLKTHDDENSETYRRIELQLRQVRDANRRRDVQIKFIYTLMCPPDRPGEVRFGVDSEEWTKDKSHLGDLNVVATAQGRARHLTSVYAQPGFYTDQWGTWLSGFAPVHDSKGRFVGAVGVDMAADSALGELHQYLVGAMVQLGSALALALAMALVLARLVSRPLHVLKRALSQIGTGDLNTRVKLSGKDEFAEVGRAVESMCKGLRERQMLKEAMARYHSRTVAEHILASGELPTLSGERRKVTVLFSDIRGFTRLSGGMSPEQVVGLLNEYFERMIEIIFQHQGTLDKFIGDGLMAVFGAPLEDRDQERHAVLAAIEMQAALVELNERWRLNRQVQLATGVGINTGVAIVGNIGSSQRMEYTAIGDTVNLASRLEALTKTVGAPILISETTRAALGDSIRLRAVGATDIRGVAMPVNVYAVGDNSTSSLAA